MCARIPMKDHACYRTEKLWNLLKLQMVCVKGWRLTTWTPVSWMVHRERTGSFHFHISLYFAWLCWSFLLLVYATSTISTFLTIATIKFIHPVLFQFYSSNVGIKIVNNAFGSSHFCNSNLTHRGSLRRLLWYINFKSSLGPIVGRVVCNSLA